MESLVPGGISFAGGGPDGRRYQELSWGYQAIIDKLPAVSGYRITSKPWGLNEIAQARLDAEELGEVEYAMSMRDDIERPGRDIAEYRFRLDRARRELVRDHLSRLMTSVDGILEDLVARVPSDGDSVVDERWDELKDAFAQLERLAGSQIPRKGAWSDLVRHLRFGQGHDLHDIAVKDWPSVRSEIQKNLYSELEPVPVEVDDLGELAESRPGGVVATALRWSNLSDEEFERLIFNLISDAEGYVNPQWLTQTRAPDRGRDLSVEHVRNDSLSGTTQVRVIIQAKHWLSRSVGVDEVAATVAQMKLWEHPPVRELVLATSGRFTTDAVVWIELHNTRNEQPWIEMWPDSHLERLLARRPYIAAAFNLR
jgi:hypothetical protein